MSEGLGETTLLVYRPSDETGGTAGRPWDVDSWVEIVFPPEDGKLHHGSTGARMPDAVRIVLDDAGVAIADAYAFTLENQYCYDTEYYLVLRVREVVDATAWAAMPWGHLGAGDVFLAWDKFHGHVYQRTAGASASMSYGGDWADLQSVVDAEHPRPEGPRPAGPPADATLLRAVRAGDLDQVRALLAAGASPEAGWDAPDEALRSVSVDRNSPALWEATMLDRPDLVEALLAAGAHVDRAPPGGMTALHGALAGRKLAAVPVLLRFGADPDAVYQGRTARAVAAAIGPEAAALLARG